VVWSETTHVGMATNGDYVCANYFPAGNMVTNESVSFARCVAHVKPAFAWRPRSELDIAAADHFRRLAVVWAVKEGDDGLLLSAARLTEVYRELGETHLAKAIETVDHDQIHVGEFARALAVEYVESKAAKECITSTTRVASFAEADLDQDFRLTDREFKVWLRENVRHDPLRTLRNRHFTEEEACDLLRTCDDDGDGMLTFSNLLDLVNTDLLLPGMIHE
jgi:Ca2+-binding EF-hand superfamily protein